jgi:hypothetical protein
MGSIPTSKSLRILYGEFREFMQINNLSHKYAGSSSACLLVARWSHDLAKTYMLLLTNAKIKKSEQTLLFSREIVLFGV